MSTSGQLLITFVAVQGLQIYIEEDRGQDQDQLDNEDDWLEWTELPLKRETAAIIASHGFSAKEKQLSQRFSIVARIARVNSFSKIKIYHPS